MTFPNKLMRLHIGGSLYTQESWSMSVHFVSTEATTPAADLAPPTEGFITGLLVGGKHHLAKLGYIKYNELDHITGKYADPGATNVKYYSPEYTNTGVASLLPQGTMCATLTTAKQRGRAHSGRIYLPGYPAVGITGHVTPAICASIADVVTNYINSVALLTGDQPVVWSKIGDSVEPVTGVKVGDVVDTQRRRRSSLPEVYHPSLITIP